MNKFPNSIFDRQIQRIRVGHLNGFLVLRDGNLNKPIFKSSVPRVLSGRDVEVSNWAAFMRKLGSFKMMTKCDNCGMRLRVTRSQVARMRAFVLGFLKPLFITDNRWHIVNLPTPIWEHYFATEHAFIDLVIFVMHLRLQKLGGFGVNSF